MFEKFANEWEFKCSPSNLYQNQSNGKVELAVKKLIKKLISKSALAKKLNKKTEQDGSDLWKATLGWRNIATKEIASCSNTTLDV